MARSRRNKILLISYHFPPSNEVGGLRIANFAKNLYLYGWRTYVLTIEDKYLKKIDTERLNNIRVEKIFKTGKLPTIIQGYLKLKRLYFSFLQRRLVTLEELENKYGQSNTNISGSQSEKITRRLKRYLFSFLTLPDTERNWILPAVIRAVREIKRNKIACILTSSPPYSVHLIGLLVKIITGVKWVADYRDPWTIGGSKKLFATSALSIKIERWLEQKVIQKSDAVITNTDMLCNAFKNLCQELQKKKISCITNGVDMEVFSKFNHLRKYSVFTIAHTGTLYYRRSPEPVFKAIHELLLEGKLNLPNIRIKLVGNVQHINGYSISQIIHSYDLDPVVEVLEPVPYLKCLEIIKQSHLALLIAPAQPFQIPAKAYDYIGLGIKILALTEEGATSDLIFSIGAGKAFYPSDIEGIKDFIHRSMQDEELLSSERNSNILDKFDTKLLTRNLAERLNEICSL